ncbi:hypothetical protein J2X32_000270 [Rheinheimera pacifica]|nr:hypothetical protein [Rheinheimera pacifica]
MTAFPDIAAPAATETEQPVTEQPAELEQQAELGYN